MKFDYVIVGGGSAGCTLAHRLGEDPSVSICVLEAGGSHKSPFVWIPSMVIALLPWRLKNWAFETTPQIELNGRKGYQPRGKASLNKTTMRGQSKVVTVGVSINVYPILKSQNTAKLVRMSCEAKVAL